ncbi:hypothetical protein O6H91_02G132500 [Diphasiastrum complanatum]|uniref:Uncharacterized protein n=1 Tax=Diphasiastrum complanatum TaxID=34168 RepID=A0ACC2EKT8_DIPCM|nr:hypothetical protein O6H91_02G132500 [Diphasiastrum complanatum]
MALRVAKRGSLGAGQRILAGRYALQMAAAAAYSDGTRRVLSEEDKAAENIYIKKMEQDRLERLARKVIW